MLKKKPLLFCARRRVVAIATERGGWANKLRPPGLARSGTLDSSLLALTLSSLLCRYNSYTRAAKGIYATGNTYALTHTHIYIYRERETHCSSVNKDEDIYPQASRERKGEKLISIKSHTRISDVGKEGNKRGRNKLEIDVHVHGG